MNKKSIFKYFKYLRVQIALYYLVTSIVLMALMGMILYYSLSSIMLNDSLKATTAAVDQSGSSIETYIDKLKALSEVIAKDSDTQNYLLTNDSTSRTKVSMLLSTVLNSDSYLTTGILVSKQGKIISNASEIDMQISTDMMNESWYVAVLESKGMPVLTSARRQVFSMDKSTWVISIGQEVVNDSGENIGVLLLDVKYDVIENQLAELDLGQEGYAFILNEYGDTVYHNDTTFFEDPLKIQMLNEISAMKDGFDSKMNMLTHHYNIEGTNWILVGLSSLDNLSAARRQILETLILVSLILLLIVLGSSYIIATKISKPILELESAMQSVSDGFQKVSVGSGSCYEVENLTKHFNLMTEKILQLMDAIKERERYLRAYEVKSLYSQINPHFLYNTLDTIVWMAEFNDSEKVIAVTKSLAQFFRISLSQGKECIPLEQELDHVRQYLYIQEQRYGDRLKYKIQCDPKLLDVEVPKIILQPIVENAIYHGIKELDGPGEINISAIVKDDTLQIIIKDNGIGFDSKAIKNEKTKLGGVGLENVSDRIKLIYGEHYGIKLESEKSKGTTVTIFLPYVVKDEA